jgi:hypothetical protein
LQVIDRSEVSMKFQVEFLLLQTSILDFLV